MKPLTREVDEILAKVIAVHTSHGFEDLRLFKSLVSAEQYRRHYYKVREYVPAGSTVLDWGCGAGHFSFGLARLGYKTYGYGFYDFELRRFVPDGFDFTLGSLDDPVTIPFDDGYFDAVVSVGVLEHVRETGGNELASLREIHRILRPGGHFLCFHFPNRLSLMERLNTMLDAEHHHTYKYDRRDIERLCRQSGLELVEVHRYGALPRNVWNRLPESLGRSRAVVRAYNLADRLLGYPLSAVCQNYLFVARKS
ncbi:MAG TPA: class I SAM-dependent methyltransferase [Actinomycetota bacterium]|nr:class I SAM-dependent methyltransferase [Actinomycetota bacterium]